MGTSTSSSGPGGGVPLVPPWVQTIGSEGSPPDQDPGVNAQEPPEQATGAGVSVKGRFGDARRNLGKFASSAKPDELRRGLKSYVARGLGGSVTAARRMAGAASRSGALFNVLAGLGTGNVNLSQLGIDASSLVGLPIQEIIDRIARFVSPSDGTQDAESSQRAINASLADLLDKDATADLAALTTSQIEWVLQRHIIHEIVQRIELDVGKVMLEKAPSPKDAIHRMKDIREYVEETVAAEFRSVGRTLTPLSGKDVADLVADTLRSTYKVFEEYTA